MSFWFGLKAVPDGMPVACGPYQTVEQANAARIKMRGTHTDVSPWFAAENEEQAEDKARWQFGGDVISQSE